MMRRIILCILQIIVMANCILASNHMGLPDDQPQEELVTETGGPSGYCDVLQFLPDGSALLAAGEDKRIWHIPFREGRFIKDKAKIIRWPIYREEEGMVYALGLEPGLKPTCLAVGGQGVRINNLSLIDIHNGSTLAAITPVASGSIRSVSIFKKPQGGQLIAFGDANGQIFFWDDQVRQPICVARHAQAINNTVILVSMITEEAFISLTRSGTLSLWEKQSNGKYSSQQLAFFENARIRQAIFSNDQEWICAIGDQSVRQTNGTVFCFNFKKRISVSLPLPERYFGRAVSLNQNGKRLVVGSLLSPEKDSTNYGIKPAQYEIFECNLDVIEPILVKTGIHTSYTIDSLAFHPDNEHLVVAGGDNNEISCWSLTTKKKVDVLEQRGKGLWQIAFSEDGREIGLRDQRNPEPKGHNDLGQGEWNAFSISAGDPGRIGWNRKNGDQFRPVSSRETSGSGWRVFPKKDSLFKWQLRSPQGNFFDLPLVEAIDQQPSCYTFLKGQPGSPEKLIVGHFLGATLFELDEVKGAVKTRIFAGHAGTTTSLSVSPDEKVLVTCSQDGTVAAYSLMPWSSNNELGASFKIRDGKIYLDKIDDGSPIWESLRARKVDINPGMEVKAVWKNGTDQDPSYWFDPENYVLNEYKELRQQRTKEHRSIGIEEAYRVLQSPRPREMMTIFFADKKWAKTSSRQKPVWKLFCARNPQTNRLQGGEWILWRWRDYYYATSTKGDDLIGWQINLGIDKTPIYYPAERFRDRFNKPHMVEKVLANISAPPEWVTFADMMPPKVTISKNEIASINKPDVQIVDVTLQQETEVVTDGSQPERVFVWLNDHKLLDAGGLKPVLNEKQQLPVPTALLRAGQENILTVKVFSKQRSRNEMELKLFNNAEPPKKVTLFGLLVGISDYSLAKQKRLVADKDLPRIEAWLLAQKGNELYNNVVIKKLQEESVSAENFRRKIKELQDQIKPDDVVVVFLSGHGIGGKQINDLIKPEQWAGNEPSKYLYLLRDFDLSRPLQTSLSDRFLADQLSLINGHKVLFFDACHAAAGVNVLRELTPEKISPAIFSACGKDEYSFEDIDLGRGEYANVLAQSTKPMVLRKFGIQNRLKADGLFEFLRYQVYTNVKRRGEQQNPEFMPALPDNSKKFLFAAPKP